MVYSMRYNKSLMLLIFCWPLHIIKRENFFNLQLQIQSDIRIEFNNFLGKKKVFLEAWKDLSKIVQQILSRYRYKSKLEPRGIIAFQCHSKNRVILIIISKIFALF